MSKICSKCDIEKPLDEFRYRKDSKDGHRANCKTCQDQNNSKYLSTLDGCITQLLGHAKAKAAERKKKRVGNQAFLLFILCLKKFLNFIFIGVNLFMKFLQIITLSSHTLL